jgi:hypothetical protein
MRQWHWRWPELGADLALFLPLLAAIAWIVEPLFAIMMRNAGCSCSAPMDWASEQSPSRVARG